MNGLFGQMIVFIPPPDKDEIHLVISDNITELNADTYLSLVDHSAMLHTLIEQNEEKHYVIVHKIGLIHIL
ncbi:hypothetical protein U3516DRAFT_916829 [Neocallimastix sp. 'constans']